MPQFDAERCEAEPFFSQIGGEESPGWFTVYLECRDGRLAHRFLIHDQQSLYTVVVLHHPSQGCLVTSFRPLAIHQRLLEESSAAKQGESRDVTFPRHTHVPLSPPKARAKPFSELHFLIVSFKFYRTGYVRSVIFVY
jgi:hypothetical protein